MANFSDPHICQCLSRIALIRRDSPVTISGGRQKTGQQFVDNILNLSSNLLELGIRVGDVVAIALYNSDYYLEWLLAVAFVGGILAPLNYRWSNSEARSAISVASPIMLVTDESCHQWYSDIDDNAVPSLKWHLFLGSVPPTLQNKLTVSFTKMPEKRCARSIPRNYLWASNGAAMICFTSGTTGQPKGVTISHSALAIQSTAKIATCGYSEDDVYLHTAPLCHIGGLSSAMAMLMVGACHVFIPKFDAEVAVQAIQKHNVTSLITVPAMIADFSSFLRGNESWEGAVCVKKVLNGGGSLSAELLKEAITLFPSAKILSAYGMTETCSSLTFMTLHDPTLYSSNQPLSMFIEWNLTSAQKPQGTCVGKPAPHVELRTDAENMCSAGRILTRGPHLMSGYWGRSHESDSSGMSWFDTGDIGYIDRAGNVWLIGRASGCIKTGGENVYPEEVEAAVLQHPGVAGAVIVGIPDARLGEMVIGCAQIRESWSWCDNRLEIGTGGTNEHVLSSSILRQFCRKRNLSGFKMPKVFMPWGSKPFPTTSTGKVRRDEVRAEVLSRRKSLICNL